MKKTVLFIMLALLCMFQSVAQEYEYVPFVREGVKWVYYFKHYHDDGYNDWVTNDYRTLELKGDTVINGKTYKAMHKYSGDAINWVCDTVPVYLREENKVVYGIIPDNRRYWDCPVYGIIDIDQEGTPHTYNGEEFVLYDFQDPVAYWSSIYDYFNSYGGEEPIPYRQLRTDTIAIGGHLAKRYSGEFLREFQLIEGIGQVAVNSTPLYFGLGIVSGAALRYSPVNESNFYLSHVIEDGEIVYKTEWYNEPEPVDSGPLPFVREGVKWVCYTKNWGDPFSWDWGDEITFELQGDTAINGKAYKAMHVYSGDAINPENDTILAYLREYDKVVYAIVPEGRTYDGFPIGMGTDSTMISKRDQGEEFVLYDFNDPVAFIQNSFNHTLETTQITIAGKRVNRYIFYPGWGLDNLCLIEGVGCDGLFGGNPMGSNGGPQLNRVIENGDVIYVAEMNHYKPESDNELPIPRQGVQWVNERVTVEEGDTTCYYYKYEFKGYDSQGYGRCYSYTGETLNTSTAINAAQYQCWDYSVNTSNGMIRNNYPFSKVKSENRDMVYYDSSLGSNYLEMYHFDLYSYSDISSEFPPKYYMGRQKENFLNRQNFVRVEPLIIQDVLCDRFAYIGENGDTLAYVVEGIGFDSRDMGDLLTPFTRRPDPTADHQEWCGLSHVIKDGQIIYKGMRYREGAFDGIDEVVVDKPRVVLDPNYYNLMGQPVGKEVPTTPGIYIHQGKKIVVQ